MKTKLGQIARIILNGTDLPVRSAKVKNYIRLTCGCAPEKNRG